MNESEAVGRIFRPVVRFDDGDADGWHHSRCSADDDDIDVTVRLKLLSASYAATGMRMFLEGSEKRK